MRWIKKKPVPKKLRVTGEIRERSGFLFFPKTMRNINREEETRWLEKADWYEEFLGYSDINPRYEYWITRQWSNE